MGDVLTRGLRLLGLLPHRSTGPVRKILFVYRFCGLGGVETSTLAKIEALRRVGIEASVFFSKFYGDGAQEWAKHPQVSVGLPDELSVVALLRQGFDAITVIDYPDFLELLNRNGVEAPILFETHCSIPSSLDRFYRCLNDPQLRAIVVPSRYNERLVRERANPRCKIVVVPNAVDDQTFRPERPRSRSVLQELPGGEKLVLWVGRLEDEKNPSDLVDIAERVLERTRAVRFLMVGDRPGQYESYKSRLMQRMTASTRPAFTFMRTIPYEFMPDLYRVVGFSGGALVSTSLHESLPMIFLEAMASGCPVISSDVGGVRDIIKDKRTGRLYPSGDVNAAVAILQELLSYRNRVTVDLMAERARQAIVSRHSLKVVARRYRSLLGGILGDVSEPGRNADHPWHLDLSG